MSEENSQHQNVVSEGPDVAAPARPASPPETTSYPTSHTDYTDEGSPFTKSYTFARSLDLLSDFTNIPLEQVRARLQGHPSFCATTAGWEATHPVPTAVLHRWLQLLYSSTGIVTGPWWTAADVVVYDAAAQKRKEAAMGGARAEQRDDVYRQCDDFAPYPLRDGSDASNLEQLFVGPAQPSRTPSPVSPRAVETAPPEAATAHPPRPMRHWRDVMRSNGPLTAFTVNTVNTVVPGRPARNPAPSFEEVFYTTLAFVEATSPRGTPVIESETSSAAEARSEASDRDVLPPTEPRERPLSPFSTQQAFELGEADRVATVSPPPPSSSAATLAELEGFVHRGKKRKICRQFVETGTCSYGARCLFHHPSSSAPEWLPRLLDTGGHDAVEHNGEGDRGAEWQRVGWGEALPAPTGRVVVTLSPLRGPVLPPTMNYPPYS